ncbi:nucleotidyltransferase family protein [Streptococcus loxodontisalivarius]|uniref:Nucleotidyltransferase family protein n=1 Tax=Streptococcus loxodontisalivarius TaxID=1349415 RepID=A0ABS2PQJ6_9STRE|nr:nucleotidyltransferase family protein [Streptococcus loxodontisalivarius]MBM7642260.1 hypothetical protein [Streptococcus loxodontisalivarius]
MDLVTLFEQDPELMRIFRIIAELGLKDSWLAAGTLRNYVWNTLSNRKGLENASDLDVIFYDPTVTYEQTLALQEDLNHRYPDYKWEVKNQVYMHSHSPNTSSYLSSCDAVSKYPERCTAIAARLNAQGHLDLFLPYGSDDIEEFIVEATPHFAADKDRMSVYRERQAKKNWSKIWTQLDVRY